MIGLSYDSMVYLRFPILAKIGEIAKSKYTGEVMSYDIDKKEFTSTKVLNWYEAPIADVLYEIHTKNEDPAMIANKFAGDHKIYTRIGWKKVGELIEGDEIFTSDWSDIVTKVAKIPFSDFVYCIDVETKNFVTLDGIVQAGDTNG